MNEIKRVKHVSELNILGVYMSDKLEFTPHMNHITTAAVQTVQSTHALRVLRVHGMTSPKLGAVTRATTVEKLTYTCSLFRIRKTVRVMYHYLNIVLSFAFDR